MFHKIFHFGQEHSDNKVIATIIRHVMRIIYHCDIPLSKNIDKTVHFCHSGFGVVINPKAIIKKKVAIQHGVTIGEKYLNSGVPYIEEGVFIGAKATVLGNIRIGRKAKIAAGAVVLCDVPAGCTAVGVPARIISPSSKA